MFDKMTNEQFACWLAGFTDGEGYIGVEPTTRKGVRAVNICIANTVKDVICGIKRRLGYGSIYCQHQRSHWKPKYTFNVGNLADAERFLSVVYPYLTIKKVCAEKAFARIAEAKSKHESRKRRDDAIRLAASSGEMRKAIANRFGVSCQHVSRVCCGHLWPSERSHVAKTRRRDHRGLFVPIS